MPEPGARVKYLDSNGRTLTVRLPVGHEANPVR